MGMMSSVSVIFDTGATYSCSSNKGYVVKLEEKASPRKLKGIAKGLEISGFGIVYHSWPLPLNFLAPSDALYGLTIAHVGTQYVPF